MSLHASQDQFARARENMVVSQLHPSGITDERVLSAYRMVPRENFVPEDKKSVAYTDVPIQLSSGEHLLEPMIHGTMVSNLNLAPGARVLILGDGSGYSSAILEALSAQSFISENHGPFDAIFMNGAVAIRPDRLISLLKTSGKLACILVENGRSLGKLIIYTKEEKGSVTNTILQDATSAYVSGFEPKAEFVF